LTNFPETKVKLQNEIKEVIGDNLENLNAETLDKMEYLKNFIKES